MFEKINLGTTFGLNCYCNDICVRLNIEIMLVHMFFFNLSWFGKRIKPVCLKIL